jgi:ion channel-forming bestrophin family protein
VRIGWRRDDLLDDEADFWGETVRVEGSATPYVMVRVVLFGAFAAAVTGIHKNVYLPDLGIDLTPFEVAGAALAVLVGLRTNTGNDRWWEARKLWGGIVNQSRNLGIIAVAYGPTDHAWRDRFARYIAVFAHVTRRSLRRQADLPEVVALIGPEETARIAAAKHRPSFVAGVLADMLRVALDGGMPAASFHQAETQRAALIDHMGACERILKTPMPPAYSIQIRRFVVLFLLAIPFGIVLKVGWLTPLVTMLVCYPLLSLDKIGTELQYPFSPNRLNHLPLDDFTTLIERNLLAMIGAARPAKEA